RYAYRDALFRGTCAILLGFGIIWLLGPRVIRELVRRKIGDRAEFDHAALNSITRDKKNVPTMGGLLIVAAMFISVALLADLHNYYIRMSMFCMLWLAALGGMDD